MAVSFLEEDKQPPRYDKQSAEAVSWSIYSIPIEEGRAPLLEQIREFISHITYMPNGTKVLLFCQSGKGRTSCMGTAHWIAKGLTAPQAIARVNKACGANDWATSARRRVLREYERFPGEVVCKRYLEFHYATEPKMRLKPCL